ncbi:MAG: hypothetical protein RIQ93_2116, partial [Verrucomicrobiota bacterium]
MRLPQVAIVTLAMGLNGPAQAAIDLANFDLSVKPEADFFHYVNGTWLKNTPIPAEFSSWGSFTELAERNRANLRRICERAAANSNATGVEKMVGDLYASGMDEARIEALGAKPLQPQLDRIAAIKERADLLPALAHLHESGVGAAFSFGSSPDLKDSTRELAQFSQGGLGLPERGYYFNADEKGQKIRQQYVAHIANMFTLLGDSRDSASVSATAVMALETKLAVAALARVQLRDPYRSYHKMTLVNALTKVPQLDLRSYLAARKIAPLTDVNLAHQEFFQGLERAMTEVALADWKAYLRW